MIDEITAETLKQLYYSMLKIRMVEEEIAKRYWDNEMRTPVHLCIGQEAVAAGVCQCLSKEDTVFSNHRGHGHYLAKGGNLNALIAELYNRQTGCSKGRGGSMHIIDRNVNFHGTSSIVAGGVPIATGAALAHKMQKTGGISVAFFGDAAIEEGTVYESVNLATLWNLPILFACENNFYAVSTSLEKRQPDTLLYKRFGGIGLKCLRLDGNDAASIYKTVSELRKEIASGGGPVFVEFVTYRLTDHHATGTGVESGYRSQEEWDSWKAKCPVKRLEKQLLEQGIYDTICLESVACGIQSEIDQAFDFAQKSSLPEEQELLEGLYSQEV